MGVAFWVNTSTGAVKLTLAEKWFIEHSYESPDGSRHLYAVVKIPDAVWRGSGLGSFGPRLPSHHLFASEVEALTASINAKMASVSEYHRRLCQLEAALVRDKERLAWIEVEALRTENT